MAPIISVLRKRLKVRAAIRSRDLRVLLNTATVRAQLSYRSPALVWPPALKQNLAPLTSLLRHLFLIQIMSRRSAILDFSIRGDELEQNRIQLEHNLQHTDLSLHLSSIPDDDYSDVEYPRHNSAPSPFSAFASFEQRSGDHFDPSEHSQYHAWSYRTVDDEDGVNPYAGETISTAAHHASALTLSAGLGGRAARRDVSLSGAEYDPDRPLQGIMAGINGRFSELDIDSTKSRHIVRASFVSGLVQHYFPRLSMIGY